MECGFPYKDAVSIMTGLKETIKGVNFIYAKGSNVFYDAKMEEKATMFGKISNRDSRSKEALLKEAVETAKKQMLWYWLLVKLLS